MSKEYPSKIRMYDHVPNSGIVHMPERRFPAVAIQGDSLSNMLTTALELMERGKGHKDEEIYYASLDLAERLRDHLVLKTGDRPRFPNHNEMRNIKM